MKLLDYSGLQRFLNKIKTLLDSKANTGHTHVTSEVTDLLNSQHTWSAQQSYSADLNLNYASTDVDDILDTVAGSYTAEDFLAQNNVWTGNNTYSKTVAIERNKDSGNFLVLKNTEAELGSLPSSITPATIAFRDKNDENLSYMGAYYDTDGSNRFRLYVKNKFTSGAPDTSGTEDFAYFGLRLNADNSKEGVLRGTFRPYDNGSYSLGSSSFQWNNLYAKKYYYNGTQWGLDQANEWTGDNTFKGIYQNQGDTNYIIPRGTNTIKGDLTTSGSFTLMFKDKNNGNLASSGIGYLTLGQNSSGSYANIGVETVGSTDNTRHSNSIVYKIDPSTNDNTAQFYPVNNNATDLGISTNQWKSVYANAYYLGTTAFGDIVTHNASEFLTSHQSLSNYVTLNGTQTITGAKTFTGGVTLSDTTKMTVKHATVVKGTNPSSTQYWQIFNCDKNGAGFQANALSIIEGTLNASGQSAIYFKACKNTANSTDSGILGVFYDTASNKAWAECPTPATADNSTKIATTAFVKAQGYLTSHQSLANYVTTNTDQTITGKKTFSDGVFATGSKWSVTTNTTDDITSLGSTFYIQQRNSGTLTDLSNGAWNVIQLGSLGLFIRNNSYGDIRYKHFASGTLGRIHTLDSSGHEIINLVPAVTNTYDLGTSTNQWNSLYAKNYFYNGTQWGLDQANVWTSYQQMVGNPTIWNMKNNSITMGGTQPTSNRYLGMLFYDSTDVEMGRMCFQCHKNGYNYYVFSINNSDGTNSYNGSVRMAASRAGAFALYPDAGTWNLGDTGAQWANIYGTNLTVFGTGVSTTPAVSDNSGKIATTAFVRSAIPYIISGGANTSAGNITLFQGTIISGFAESSSVSYSTNFGGVLTSTSALYYAVCIYDTSNSTMTFSKGPAVKGTGTWKLMGGGSSNPGTSTKLLFGLWVKIA